MPMVELVAKRTLLRYPKIGLEIQDLIILLWMFSSPYDNNRRQLNSLKYILRRSKTIQNPMGEIRLTDDELTQLVLKSLKELKKRDLVHVISSDDTYVEGSLTKKGTKLVMKYVPSPLLRRLTSEFGDNP
ncbi:MAG: hypothetical protein GF411_02120 [Candidatus Lokiarchaeota archaeon]|nr:hypothetical protein [Candidatus Lokiarchaeota archaeon]